MMSQIWPGEGAIKFIQSNTIGMTRKEAAAVIRRLLTEPSDDPRVKRCACCGYPFRNKTGKAKVCGQTCRRIVKTFQRRVQRARKSVGKPKKPIQYYYWLEYPFWISEKAMQTYHWNRERPYDHDKLDQIVTAKERNERMGRRKKPNYRPEY